MLKVDGGNVNGGRKMRGAVESFNIINRRSDSMTIDDNKKILEAIGRQRWFRFKNKKNVIFDRDTNLLWADSSTFPYGKNANTMPYSAAENYAEVKKMLRVKNAHWFGNCLDWSLPTVDELLKLVDDKTFPLLKGESRRIRWKNNWCTQSGCIDLEQTDGAVSKDDAFAIPCSHAYVPSAPKSTLDIFIDNQLDPIFDDYEINNLYRRMYNPPTASPPSLVPGKPVNSMPVEIAEPEYRPSLDKYEIDDDLIRRHDKLKKHLALIAANKDRILDAIKHQRWFQFNNTRTVIFDRNTNLLWIDLKSFPYGKNSNKVPYSSADNYAEVKEMLDMKNAHWLGNCLDWTLPTVEEILTLVEDGTFPLLRGSRRIRWKRHWCTQSGCIDLDQTDGAVSNEDAFVIPCSHAYVPSTPKSTLDIFIDNQLDPIFDDYEIGELYRRLYDPPLYPTIRRPVPSPISFFQKTDLLAYITDLEDQIAQFKALADSAQRIAR